MPGKTLWRLALLRRLFIAGEDFVRVVPSSVVEEEEDADDLLESKEPMTPPATPSRTVNAISPPTIHLQRFLPLVCLASHALFSTPVVPFAPSWPYDPPASRPKPANIPPAAPPAAAFRGCMGANGSSSSSAISIGSIVPKAARLGVS